MSIHNFSSKIKSNNTIDKSTFMYLFVVILVGISAFGLGRLSVNNSNGEVPLSLEYKDSPSKPMPYDTDIPIKNTIPVVNKKYIASKNGKLYYTIDCAGAKRIKESNAIYFSNSLDAEKLGYHLSSSCH